jgi:hypothetical protein
VEVKSYRKLHQKWKCAPASFMEYRTVSLICVGVFGFAGGVLS